MQFELTKIFTSVIKASAVIYENLVYRMVKYEWKHYINGERRAIFGSAKKSRNQVPIRKGGLTILASHIKKYLGPFSLSK